MIVVERLLADADVLQWRRTLDTVPWQSGAQTAMGMASEVKNNRQADAQDPQVQQLANALLSHIGHASALISAALPQQIFPPCFNRYGVDEAYGDHVDAAIMRLPNSQQVLRSDLSMTLFLNAPSEYDGGELVIHTEFGQQRLKLAAGMAVLYPSSSLHQVTAVTRGERHAAITWMQSLVADQSLRHTLYQLDQSIQALAQQGHTARAELDRLHHVYHNLIRQFAQP